MRRLLIPLAIVLAVAVASPCAGALAPPPSPVITFSADGAAVRGLTPSGQVAWFAIEYRDVDYATEIDRHADLATASTEGSARFALGRASATAAIWIAVDVASGAYDVATPAGFRLRQLTPPPTAAARGDGSAPDHLTDPRGYIEVVAVRPGVGAWTFHGGDGGIDDDDGQADGELQLSLDRLVPLASSPPSDGHLGEQDLWFVIDPNRMELSILKGGEPQ
jgi:hypothetical protein